MRVPIKWLANSLAADDVSAWIKLPSATKKCCAAIGWTAASDAPTGTIAAQVSNHGKSGTAGKALTATVSPQPAGSASTTLIQDMAPTAGYIRFIYTRTSGGVGCVFTDDTGTSGTTPSLEIKE